jgi:hypothetical protein
MTIGRHGFAFLALVAACSGGGGELREATERRRAENAGNDTAPGAVSVDTTGEYRLPAFVDTSGAAPAAASDTVPAAGANPQGQAEWSTSTREAGKAGAGASILRAMRVGRNEGFDRLVLDFGDSAVPPYHIEYVDSPVRSCGSGEAVPVAGQGWLKVRLRAAQAHDDAGNARSSPPRPCCAKWRSSATSRERWRWCWVCKLPTLTAFSWCRLRTG